MDEATARALQGHFHLQGDAGDEVLVGERDEHTEGQHGPVLPFLGRERELETLDGVLLECLRGESRASAVTLLGPAGAGKSRLRLEWLRSLSAPRPVVTLVLRGDPMQVEQPLTALKRGLRRYFRLEDGSAQTEQQARLQTIAGRWGVAHRVGMLGELLGVPGNSRLTRSSRRLWETAHSCDRDCVK